MSFEDIQTCLESDWPRGANIWHLRENRQLHPQDVVLPECGHVFVILPGHSDPRDWEALGSRIRHPWNWARDVQALGLLLFLEAWTTLSSWAHKAGIEFCICQGCTGKASQDTLQTDVACIQMGST